MHVCFVFIIIVKIVIRGLLLFLCLSMQGDEGMIMKKEGRQKSS